MKKILKKIGIIICLLITGFGMFGYIKTGVNLKKGKDYYNKYIG